MELIQHESRWKTGVRVLLLKGRHKDGLEVQRTFLRVTDCEKEFDRALDELVHLSWPAERLYVTASPRKLEGAIRLFKERQLANDYSAEPEAFYSRLWDRWVSCLMAQSVQEKSGKVWMFDCDSPTDLKAALACLTAHNQGDLLYEYPTKNGTHLLFKPFNKMLMMGDVRPLLQENPLMLWGY